MQTWIVPAAKHACVCMRDMRAGLRQRTATVTSMRKMVRHAQGLHGAAESYDMACGFVLGELASTNLYYECRQIRTIYHVLNVPIRSFTHRKSPTSHKSTKVGLTRKQLMCRVPFEPGARAIGGLQRTFTQSHDVCGTLASASQ